MIKDMNDKDFESKEIALFENQYLAAMKKLAEMTKAKTKLEAEEKTVKAKLQKAMDEYGIKSIDNAVITITRVAAGADKITIDLEAFAEQEPETYADLIKDYPKTVKGKAAYVAFKVKA